MKRATICAVLGVALLVLSLANAEVREAVLNRWFDADAANMRFGTQYDGLTDAVRELHDDHATSKTSHDELVSTLNELITETRRDGIASSASFTGGANLGADDDIAENFDSKSTIQIDYKGFRIPIAAGADVDLSALTCGDDIITQDKFGAVWVFVNTAGTYDAETPVTAGTQAYTSAVNALATYSTATNTVPPGTGDVCLGCVVIEENDSGDFTIGTGSISAETETWYSLLPGTFPGVLSAGTIEADSDATTFSYASNSVLLGTGTVVTGTGKANVAMPTDTVATAYVGAYLFYMLADDTEAVVQLGTYTTAALAQAAVRDHTPNPLLALVGVVYVANASGSTFTGATTKLDATGVTTTITALGTGSAHLEIGRAALNQPHAALSNAGPATLTASKPDEVK